MPASPAVPLASAALLLGLSRLTGPGLTRLARLSLGIQWSVFLLHAFPSQSELLYDASGAATHVALAVASLLGGRAHAGVVTTNARAAVNTVLSVVWATRLGSFLLTRIIRDGGVDHRFDKLKRGGFWSFAVPWTIQAAWCFVGQLPVMIANARAAASPDDQVQQRQQATTRTQINRRDAVGWTLWAAGFALEVLADAQKNAFQFDAAY